MKQLRHVILLLLFGCACLPDTHDRTSSEPVISSDTFVHDRSSSAPFISGDTFRLESDFTYDELRRDMDPARVKYGSIVFVKTDSLGEYFANIHPHIRHPYILLTHNSDHHVPGRFASYLADDKILAWFGQNVENCEHPKMHHIPIGIANRMWPHGNVETFKEAQLRISSNERPNLLYMNFSPNTYLEERSRVASMFKDQPFCVAAEPKAMREYLADLAQTKFVLSPRGNGLDCHRTWEALLMGAIPIVKTSSLDRMYKGLPVVIVNDWNEVDESFLNRKYEEMKARDYQRERAYAPYWINKIRSFQPKAAVTYDLGGGRFGDKLIGYLHAKWISYRYAMPLLYQPFTYSDQLVLHEAEQPFPGYDAYERTINQSADAHEGFRNDISALYVIPYFPEALWELTPQNNWYYFPVDWADAGFKNEIKRLIAPAQAQARISLPTDRIRVAVHMRLGGGFDDEHTVRHAPLKLPPISYYKEQIRTIYDLLKQKPLYVHIFTDDKDPVRLAKECQEFTKDLDIEYGFRFTGNAHDSNVIDDFFAMTKFDCLIRSESNFAIAASKLSDFMIEISPAHFSWTSDGVGHVDQVNVRYKD